MKAPSAPKHLIVEPTYRSNGEIEVITINFDAVVSLCCIGNNIIVTVLLLLGYSTLIMT